MSGPNASTRKRARSEAKPSEVHQVGTRKRARSEAMPSEVHEVGPRKRSAQRAEGERSSLRPAEGQRRSRTSGFTLLEVMAAVALLGILYTVLARVAIEGLRAEGESQRRIEASLLADERAANSFTGFEGGVVMPPLGHSETTEGDFTVGLDVTMFEPPVEWNVTDSVDRTPLLFASTPGVPGAQALRTVQLSVSWLEGADARRVSRIIYLVDFDRVSALAGPLESAAAQAGKPAAPKTGKPVAPEAPGEAAPPSELELP